MKKILTICGLMIASASPLLSFTNGQKASYVLGEPNFSNASHNFTQNGLPSPSDVTYDPTRQWYFVLDNHRVLIYDVSRGITTGMNATWVLGQQDFTSSVWTTTQNGMYADGTLGGLAFDPVHHLLFVSDYNSQAWSSRILVYDLSVSSNIQNGMNASWVLGQPDFTTSNMYPTNANSFLGVAGLSYDPVHQRLFVADSSDSRVVVFDFLLSGGISNNMNASYVFGQTDFNSKLSATSQSGMSYVRAVLFDPVYQRLFVGDSGNSRVLMFDLSGPPSTWNDGVHVGGMNASAVLGQPDFVSNNPNGCTQSNLTYGGLAYDPANQRLFVSNNNQKRVMIFDVSQGITNGMNAIAELGEPDFTTCGVSANGPIHLGSVVGITYDLTHQRLLATDYTMGRVMIWTDLVLPSPPAWCNGQNASAVLGQSDFTSNLQSTTQNTMNSPKEDAYDAVHQRLFVADYGGSRVLIYDVSGGVTNGMNAAYVLGQQDFNSQIAATTQNGMSGPFSLSYDPAFERLYVEDVGGGGVRILVFDLSQGITNGMNASYVLGAGNFTSASQGLNRWAFMRFSPITIDPATQWLYVSDSNNNRVMVFDLSGGITNGMPAAHVLGQPDFTTNVAQVTQTGMTQPSAVAVDPVQQRLFVGDTNRLLIFNLSGGITDNMPATNVLGQPTFTASPYNSASQNTMHTIASLSYDPIYQQLFVADYFRRVLKFDLSGGITNNMNASDVFGQSDFNSSAGATTQSGMTHPMGVGAYDPVHQRLFVGDQNTNNRVLMFASGQGCVGGSGGGGGNGPGGPGLPSGCGSSSMICGSVSAADSPGTYLPNVPIQLRDAQGSLLTTTKTNSSGGYGFASGGLSLGSTYYVVPLVGPRESAMPLNYPVPNLTSAGATANLQVSGWPATIQVTGNTVGSFILISTYSYTGTYPPSMTAAASSGNFYSSSAGLDGVASIPVPTGSSYYITSWASQCSGSAVTYNRVPATGSVTLGSSVIPGQVATIQSPS